MALERRRGEREEEKKMEKRGAKYGIESRRWVDFGWDGITGGERRRRRER